MSDQMPLAVRNKLLDLRKRSRRGEYLSPADLDFLKQQYESYPEEYRRIGEEAFELTKPFGSRIKPFGTSI